VGEIHTQYLFATAQQAMLSRIGRILAWTSEIECRLSHFLGTFLVDALLAFRRRFYTGIEETRYCGLFLTRVQEVGDE
jgi:hypothetical protein